MAQKRKTSSTQNSRINAAGFTSLILGIIAAAWGVAPGFNYFALPIAIAAVIFGIVALNSKNSNGNIGRKKFSITGIILGVVGLLFGIIWAIFLPGMTQEIEDEENSYEDRYERSESSSSRSRSTNTDRNDSTTKRN